MQEYLITIGRPVLAEHSFSLRKRQIRFQTKMEDLSVEVYGDNGAYYKVCKLWSTIKFRISRTILISVISRYLFAMINTSVIHILSKIFFREDHHGWNGRHVRLSGRDFSMCCNNYAAQSIFNRSVSVMKLERPLMPF